MIGITRQSFRFAAMILLAYYRTATIAMTITNKATSRSSHYHCYLLRSLDPNHPHKTYVGFTVSQYSYNQL